MNQVGMTLPGGKSSRGPGMDIYTVLIFVAVVALAAAAAFVYIGGTKVSQNGTPWTPQEEGQPVRLPS